MRLAALAPTIQPVKCSGINRVLKFRSSSKIRSFLSLIEDAFLCIHYKQQLTTIVVQNCLLQFGQKLLSLSLFLYVRKYV